MIKSLSICDYIQSGINYNNRSFNNAVSSFIPLCESLSPGIDSFERVSSSNKAENADMVTNPSGRIRQPQGDANLARQIKQIARLKNKNVDVDHLTPQAQKHLINIINYAKKLGYNVQINSGYRTYEWQYEQFFIKKNPNATHPDKSRHLKGDAYDLYFYNNKGRAPQSIYHKIGKYAEETLGMRYGGFCEKHAEDWHFDHGRNKKDLYEL